MVATTKELEKVWAQIQSLEEDLKKAKEYVAVMANMGQTTSAATEPVPPANLQEEAPETDAQLVVSTAPEKDVE